MEPLKKIYYRPNAIIKSPVIFLPLLMIAAALFLALSGIDRVVLCCFGLGALLLIIGLHLAVKSALTFYPEGVAFFDKHFISFDEIEQIIIPSSRELMLFSLKQKNARTGRINNWQIYPLQRNNLTWLLHNKQPNDIILNNINGLDTRPEELLVCFPADIPVTFDED